MAITRRPVTMRKYGAKSYGYETPYHDEVVYLEEYTKDPIPPSTPRFDNIEDDPTVKETYARFKHLIDNLPVARRAHKTAQSEYERVLNDYANGSVSMETVDKNKQLLSHAESTLDATQRSIVPAQMAAMIARRAAVDSGIAAFHKNVEPLTQERGRLLARMEELDRLYIHLGNSFQRSDSPAASFLATSNLSGTLGMTYGYACDDAIDRFIWDNLDIPEENSPEPVREKSEPIRWKKDNN